jgi:hypothetical protein
LSALRTPISASDPSDLSVLSDWGLLSQVAPARSAPWGVVSFTWVTRFSPRSAQGRRMMGSGRPDVSICFTTLPAFGRQVLDSKRDRLALRPHGNDLLHPSGEFLLFSEFPRQAIFG